MNFKKLAEQKIDELSGKVSSKNVENDSIDLVLEGLDEELSLENTDETFELELVEDTENDVEFSNKIEYEETSVENLFDGYLGEQREAPNPLEYGPNATYRNLREGVVYKKGPDNLWETFVKDGQNGKQGAAGGSGTGVEEVKRIVTTALSNISISANSLPAYPSNNYVYYPEIKNEFNDSIVALWDFSEDIGEEKVSKIGYPYAIKDGHATVSVARVSGGPLSNYSGSFDGVGFFRLESSLVGDLNLGALGDEVTVIAIAKHTSLANAQCLVGMWQETNSDALRQYALFTSLTTYGGANNVCAHISVSGGTSPKVLTSGFLPFSRDYASNVSIIEAGVWTYQAMTYDGNVIKAYIDGKFEPRPVYTEPGPSNGEGLTYSKNPYIYTSGLNRITKPASFSIGANRLAGWTNQFVGELAGVAIFKKALTQQEIVKFQRLVQGNNRPNINYAMYHNSYAGGERGVNNIGWASLYGATALSGNNSFAWYLAFPTSGTIHYVEKKPTANQAIFYDDQNFGIDISTVNKLTVDTNNANTTDIIKFAIKANSTWYISNTSFTQTVSGISGTDWTNVETKTLSSVSSELWLPLTIVPGSTFTIGTAVTLPVGTVVNALGIYSPATTNFVRVRNLALW